MRAVKTSATPARRTTGKQRLRRRLPGVMSVDPPSAADKPHWPWPRPGAHRIGICCSGGGIRSASYCLGALQALQEAGVLEEAEYLATVSGGGYIGGALTMIATGSDRTLVWEDGRPRPFARMSPEERFLRDHSTYLAPNTRGKGRLVFRLLLGMIVNLAFIGAIVVFCGRLLGWFAGVVEPHPLRGHAGLANWHVAPWLAGTGIAAGVGLLLVLVTATVLTTPTVERALMRAGGAIAAGAIGVFTVVIGLPGAIVGVRNAASGIAFAVDWLFRHLTPVSNATPSASHHGSAIVAEAAAVLTALGLPTLLLGVVRSGIKTERSKLALAAGGIVGPFLLAYVLLAAASDAAGRSWGTRQWAWLIPTAAIALALWLFGDLTVGSMHPFYKQRLATAFALRRRWRRPDGTLTDTAEPDGELAATYADALVPLSTTRIGRRWPTLVCCASANVSDIGVTPPGRKAVSFTFDADWVGGPDIGYARTRAFEDALGRRRAADMTLLTAMAVSGAAISPSMGRATRPSLRFLLTLTNARLGMWLPHPKRVCDRNTENNERAESGRRPKAWRSRPRFTYLWRELSGRNTTRAPFLYVTDGGHWENLGVVELLRRRCTTIYCIDASADDAHTFTGIGQAIALARSELGVEIELDPTPMRTPDPTDESYTSTDFAVGTMRWLGQRTPDVAGRLLFIKTAVTKQAPWDVRAYKLHDPKFPNDSTLQQLYGDDRFESYRALGHDTMTRAHAAFVAPSSVDLTTDAPLQAQPARE